MEWAHSIILPERKILSLDFCLEFFAHSFLDTMYHVDTNDGVDTPAFISARRGDFLIYFFFSSSWLSLYVMDF